MSLKVRIIKYIYIKSIEEPKKADDNKNKTKSLRDRLRKLKQEEKKKEEDNKDNENKNEENKENDEDKDKKEEEKKQEENNDEKKEENKIEENNVKEGNEKLITLEDQIKEKKDDNLVMKSPKKKKLKLLK